MITEKEYLKALSIVEQNQAITATVPKTTRITDCRMSTRGLNLLARIGEENGLGPSYELRLKDFEGLQKDQLRNIRGLGGKTLKEIESVLGMAGITLR